jgi:hypothetical protein
MDISSYNITKVSKIYMKIKKSVVVQTVILKFKVKIVLEYVQLVS